MKHYYEQFDLIEYFKKKNDFELSISIEDGSANFWMKNIYFQWNLIIVVEFMVIWRGFFLLSAYDISSVPTWQQRNCNICACVDDSKSADIYFKTRAKHKLWTVQTPGFSPQLSSAEYLFFYLLI